MNPTPIQFAALGFSVFALFYVGLAHASGVPLTEIWEVTYEMVITNQSR